MYRSLRLRYLWRVRKVIEMTKDEQYKEFISHLRSRNLDYTEYERRVREWCVKNKY
jgi:hypothetical protein